MIMIVEIIILIFLILVAGLVLNFILDIGNLLLQIVAYILSGWILLTIVNFLPGIDVPINIITILISGVGGVVGTVILVIFSLIF